MVSGNLETGPCGALFHLPEILIDKGMRQFKTGIVQFDVQKGQTQANIDTVLAYMDALADNGVCLAVLPEMFSCSFDNAHLAEHIQMSPIVLEKLSAKAGQRKIAVAGSLPMLTKGGICNTMVFIDTNGQIKGRYEKLHLFKLTREDQYYTPGSRMGVADTSLGRVGLMICYDLRFPELSRSLALEDVNMLIISAQWPTPRKNHWQALLIARAIENQLYVVGTNRTGQEDGVPFPGYSLVIDPSGNVLNTPEKKAGIGWGDIDLDTVPAVRSAIPCFSDRRSDVYG
jgi:omega-amidase